MTTAFAPEKDIPEDFWRFIEANQTDDQVRASLAGMSKEEVVTLFKSCLEARTELAYQLAETGRSEDASEDALDDLSEGIISEGRRVYLDSYHGRTALPPHDEWERKRGLIHLFAAVYRQRYGGNVFDEVEE